MNNYFMSEIIIILVSSSPSLIYIYFYIYVSKCISRFDISCADSAGDLSGAHEEACRHIHLIVLFCVDNTRWIQTLYCLYSNVMTQNNTQIFTSDIICLSLQLRSSRVVGSEFVQKYLGEGPRMVRDVFRAGERKCSCHHLHWWDWCYCH